MAKHDEGSSSQSGSSNDGCNPKLSAYAKVDATLSAERHKGCTPVMVSVTAPSEIAKQRTPIDVVLVLHVHIRFAAPTNWHDLINRALELLLAKLGDNDRLAVVPALLKEAKIIFEDAVIAPVKPRLLLMSDENKEATRSAVKSSEAMRSNSPLVRDLESAESLLYGRPSRDKAERAGYIVVISNSNEDLSSVLSWRLRSVHAFGFQDAHNEKAMYTITKSGDSAFAILDTGGEITDAFRAIIEKITSAIEPVEVKLKCNEEVLLSEIFAPRIHYFISSDKKVGIVWAHDRRAGAPTNFLIFLEIPDDYYEYNNLLEVDGNFGHPHNSITVKGGPLIPVRKGMHGSIEVAAEIVRMEALDIVTEITEEHQNDTEKHKFHDATQKKLLTWLCLLKESNYGSEAAEAAAVQELAEKMQEMQKLHKENNLWLECMLSWRSNQWWPLQPLIITNERHATSGATSDSSVITTHRKPLVRLKILAKVDAIPVPMQKPQRGLPVLVHIMLPQETKLEEKQRVPLDLVAVIDVTKGSSARNEKKLNLLHKVMGFVMEKLSDKDRLAIVTVHSTDAKSGAAFFQMSIEGRSECMNVLSAVLTSSVTKDSQKTTYRREQLNTTLCFPMARVSSSSTVQGRNRLSKSVKDAVKLLDGRERDKQDDKISMGLIIAISDSDNTSVCHRTLSSNKYTIHAFSLCSVANSRALYGIASRSNGIYGFFDENCDEITEAFNTCINNITSTIAAETEVKITCSSSSAKLSTITSGRHFRSSIKADKKSGSINVGALYPGAERKFIVYIEDVREDEYGHLSKILTVNVTLDHATNEKFDGQMVIVRGYDHGSKELVEEIIRTEELKIVSAITDPKTQTDDNLHKVQKLHKRLRAQAAYIREGSNYALAVDEESFARLASDIMDGSWYPNMLSWLSFQGLSEQSPPPSNNAH